MNKKRIKISEIIDFTNFEEIKELNEKRKELDKMEIEETKRKVKEIIEKSKNGKKIGE